MSTISEDLKSIYLRDLDRAMEEISQYENEADLWHSPDGINNPAGTLALHLAGNLQHFIGAVLGNSGYERNRDLEFSRRDATKDEMLSELEEAKKSVSQTLDKLSPEKFEEMYPLLFHDKKVTVHWMLSHLAVHLNYHLGQLNYLRRLTN